jgi:hypothetical protein
MTPHRKQMLIGLALAGVVSLVGCAQSHATPRHKHQHHAHRFVPHKHHHHRHHRRYIDANGNRAEFIGGRPAGCPHAYCGCGLARYLGLSDKRLNLAWNWARFFPHTHAHSGAVAVRHHHVMQLVEHVGGSLWKVRDYNGGHHLSWIHVRDVRGYVFVDPRARTAEL